MMWDNSFYLIVLVLIRTPSATLTDKNAKRSSHRRAEDIARSDACPDTQNPNKKPYKLIEMTLNGETRRCCGGNPGERLVKLCLLEQRNTAKFIPCDDGTYIDEFVHGRSECSIDKLECGDINAAYIPSNKTEAPKCVCVDGFYLAANKTCTSHKKCPPGSGVRTPGSPYNDTLCDLCPRGFDSPSWSATDKCHLTEKILDIPANQYLKSRFDPPSNQTGNVSQPCDVIDTSTSTVASFSDISSSSESCNEEAKLRSDVPWKIYPFLVIIGVILGGVLFFILDCFGLLSQIKKKFYCRKKNEAEEKDGVVDSHTGLVKKVPHGHAEEDSESSDDSMASDKDIGSIKGKCNPLN